MNKRKIDIRNKEAFWSLAADRLALRMPKSNTNEYDSARTWLGRRACPCITERSIGNAARILDVQISEVLMTLTGHESIDAARLSAWRAWHNNRRGDVNQDGTRNRSCRWCGRKFISIYAQGAPTCSDCYEGNAKYRKRLAVEIGKQREYSAARIASGRAAERKRNRRAARVAIRKLAAIRRQCDRIDRDMQNDILTLYRSVYRMRRVAMATAIAKDNDRRAKKRRRLLDPASGRGAAGNPWIFDVYKDFGYACAYCGMTRESARAEGFDLQADHIVPLGHPCCVHGPANCAPACIHCNSSKGNRDLKEWSLLKTLSPHPLAVRKYEQLMAKATMTQLPHSRTT